MMRFISDSLDGLWSMLIARGFPSSIRIALESPAFATNSCSYGFMTATTAVHPDYIFSVALSKSRNTLQRLLQTSFES